tara:strand:- start:535 stop:783 length:249 start_codon:yes stop_codon:yes gene_type:complete
MKKGWKHLNLEMTWTNLGQLWQIEIDLRDDQREMLKMLQDKRATQERHALMIIELYKKDAEVNSLRNSLDQACVEKQHLGKR